MLDIQNENVEIVDIAKISNVVSQAEDEAIINNFDADQPETSQIVITNVQSMADNPSESDKECSSDNTVIDQGNNLEKNEDDPLVTLLDKECKDENSTVDQGNDPLMTLQCVSEGDCTERNEAEEKVLESEFPVKEDQTEVVTEMEKSSKAARPLEALEMEDKDSVDDIQKPLRSVEVSGNDQEVIDNTLLEEVPLEPMETDTKGEELVHDISKLEEIQSEPMEMSDKGQELIKKPQDIKENGLEDSPDILKKTTEEPPTPIIDNSNVEAELEECLIASTSTLVNPVVPQKIEFFDNEDFTKDVELEDLSCSKPSPNWSSFKDESEFLGDREMVTDTVDFSEVEQFSAEGEEESRLEDSLLADLDDEMTLKEDSGRTNDNPEKTLEMIVQDLNDSLYEMEK